MGPAFQQFTEFSTGLSSGSSQSVSSRNHVQPRALRPSQRCKMGGAGITLHPATSENRSICSTVSRGIGPSLHPRGVPGADGVLRKERFPPPGLCTFQPRLAGFAQDCPRLDVRGSLNSPGFHRTVARSGDNMSTTGAIVPLSVDG